MAAVGTVVSQEVFVNQLYQGDNLAILKEMPDASVDLICTDPPFNTGKDWGAFNDKWEGGLKGYLKFIEPRCVEMRRVLKDTGSLYLHCDPTASHYLKVMLDGVFGIKQFRNEIVWGYRTGGASKRQWSRKHDIFLFYSMSNKYAHNPLKERVYFENPFFVKEKDDDGRYYADVYMRDIWHDIKALLNISKERLGYPTQKPIALYQRMIKASSNQGDTVLDPFAGSGTTLDAAQTLGRHWIGIDISADAIAVTEERLNQRHGLFLKYELINSSQ